MLEHRCSQRVEGDHEALISARGSSIPFKISKLSLHGLFVGANAAPAKDSFVGVTASTRFLETLPGYLNAPESMTAEVTGKS